MEEVYSSNEVEVEEEEAKAPPEKEEEDEGSQQIDATPMWLGRAGPFHPSTRSSLCSATAASVSMIDKQAPSSDFELKSNAFRNFCCLRHTCSAGTQALVLGAVVTHHNPILSSHAISFVDIFPISTPPRLPPALSLLGEDDRSGRKS